MSPEKFKYEISPGDDALHPLGHPDYYEFWYFDGLFENGYSIAVSYHYGTLNHPNSKARFIEFNMGLPDGRQKFIRSLFEEEDCDASTETCAVRMGENTISGEIPRVTINFSEKGFGANLVFESMVEGVKPNPDAFLHRIQGRFFAWVNVQPRARISGTLVVDGKEIEVKGTGYHDHNWGNAPVTFFFDYWHWIKLFLPDFTFNCFNSRSTIELGSQSLDHWLIAFSGENLLEWTHKVDPYLADFVTDPNTGVSYPGKALLKVNGDMVKGEITAQVRKVINSIPMNPNNKDRAYFRFISDVDVDLIVKGKEIKTNTEIVNEFMKP